MRPDRSVAPADRRDALGEAAGAPDGARAPRAAAAVWVDRRVSLIAAARGGMPAPAGAHGRGKPPWHVLRAARTGTTAPAIGAAVLVSAALAAWMAPAAAARTGALAAAAAGAGLALLGASDVRPPSVLTAGALALVTAGATLTLGALALAIARLPIAPATVLAIAALPVVAAVAVHRRGRAHAADRAAPASQSDTASPDGGELPSRAQLVVATVVTAAVALLVLGPGPEALALIGYAGLFAWRLGFSGGSLRGRGSGVAGEPATPDPRETRLRRLAAHADVLPIALVALVLGTRLVPFLRSAVPLGYDTGLYRAVQRDFAAALPALPAFPPHAWAAAQPPGLFLLSDLLHLAGVPADAALWGLLVLAQLVGGAGIWLLANDTAGRRAAHWALVLFALSTVQYTIFYDVYFKQVLALALLPYVLWLWRRESWLAVPVGAFLAATHNMSFLLLGLVLLSDTLWLERHPGGPRAAVRALLARRYQLVAGGCVLVLGLAGYAFAPRAIGDFLSPDVAATLARFGVGAQASAGSLRVDPRYYVALVLPLVPFAALACAARWRNARLRLVLLWAAWAGVFAFGNLIFARRFIASFDPAFVMLAAVALGALTAGPLAGAARPFAAIAVLSAVLLLGRTMRDLRPAIAIDDLRDLQTASHAIPADAYLMSIEGSDSAWVRGYGAHDTIAPGLLGYDRWSESQWATFWAPPSPDARYALLAMYDHPIYVFMRADRTNPGIVEDPRFERVTRTLWRYVPPVGQR